MNNRANDSEFQDAMRYIRMNGPELDLNNVQDALDKLKEAKKKLKHSISHLERQIHALNQLAAHIRSTPLSGNVYYQIYHPLAGSIEQVATSNAVLLEDVRHVDVAGAGWTPASDSEDQDDGRDGREAQIEQKPDREEADDAEREQSGEKEKTFDDEESTEEEL